MKLKNNIYKLYMSSILALVLSYRMVKSLKVNKTNLFIKKYNNKTYGEYVIKNVLYSELSDKNARKKKS
jgi:hypothetical protein